MEDRVKKLYTLTDIAIDVLTGSFVSAFAKTFTAPLDRVKLILQTQDGNISLRSKRYAGVTDCFRKLYEEQGLRSFWRGNFINILRYFPTMAFKLTYVDTVRNNFPRYSKKREYVNYILVNLLATSMSVAGALFWSYPFDYIRTKLAADGHPLNRPYSGFMDCFKSTINGRNGFKGLYSGFTMALVTIVPRNTIFLTGFSQLRNENPFSHKNNFIAFTIFNFVVGSFTSAFASLACYPLETVKNRLILQGDKPLEGRVYVGIVDCFKKIIQEEGLSGFYKGVGLEICRVYSTTIAIVMYSEMKERFDKITAYKYKI
jgi:solute carrier family 25 (adenine nucleotide translocator) protein 4/5/6/31